MVFMKYSEAALGRVFVVRLEEGDVVHVSIEAIAEKESIKAASVIILGGAGPSSRFVVGPEDGLARPVVPMEHVLDNVHEVAGVGTIFPDEKGVPVLHMHMACGRKDETVTGCVRRGVKVWQVMEAVIIELTGTRAVRAFDKATGFSLLDPR